MSVYVLVTFLLVSVQVDWSLKGGLGTPVRSGGTVVIEWCGQAGSLIPSAGQQIKGTYVKRSRWKMVVSRQSRAGH